MSLDKRKSFQLHYNFYDQFSLLSMKDRGELITAIFEYSMDGTVSRSLSPVVNMAFSCIKFVLDLEKAAYAERCAKNAANGKKGGRPSVKEGLAEVVTEVVAEAIDGQSVPVPTEASERQEETFASTEASGGEEDISIPTEACDTKAEPKEERKEAVIPTDISDAERERLMSVGVPSEYIDERLPRALDNVRASASPNRTVFSVILDWWEQDKAQYNRKQSYQNNQNNQRASRASQSDQGQKSYDLDDFFNASANRSLKAFEERYGPIAV